MTNKQEWTKCSDRLPDKDGRYIIYAPYVHRNWIVISSLRNGNFDETGTTHWMELPSKPEDE
jgi:hypothetical protein